MINLPKRNLIRQRVHARRHHQHRPSRLQQDGADIERTMQIAQAGEFVQNTFGSIIYALVLLNNIAGQRKPILIWLLVSLDEQYLKLSCFKTKYHTVDGEN